MNKPIDLLLVTLGSSGDVHPFVGLGKAMIARGHRVSLVTNGHFRQLVQDAGIDFVEFKTAEEYLEMIRDPDLWDGFKGFRFIMDEAILPALEPIYQIIKDRYVPGRTVVAASTLALGARLAQEKLGVPTATVHLSPAILRSIECPPRLPMVNFAPWTPHWYRRFVFWAADTLLVDRVIGEELTPLRKKLGLGPARSILGDWFNSPDLVLAMFPDWFAPPPNDWPSQVVLAGFPLFDGRGHELVSGDPMGFVEAGDPPILFTAGTAMTTGQRFFAESAEACVKLNRRGMLLTRFKDQLPATLPPNVRHFDYIPFSAILPRVAAIVHHGGIGTTSQALAAGIPQLVMPMSHDQPDNAHRLATLGVGDHLIPAHYRAAAVAAKLKAMIDDPDYRSRALAVAQLLRASPPLVRACEALEELAARRAAE